MGSIETQKHSVITRNPPPMLGQSGVRDEHLPAVPSLHALLSFGRALVEKRAMLVLTAKEAW